MKSLIFFSILLFILFSCDNKEATQKDARESVVVARIAGGDGVKVVLSVKGEDFEKRQEQVIKNDTVTFTVPIRNSDEAWIEFADNLENHQNSRHFIPLYLEDDTVEVSAQYVKDSIQVDIDVFEPFYKFRNRSFTKGEINKEYDAANDKIFALSRGITYSYDILDSLNSTIFPSIRNEAFKLFENEYKDLGNRVKLALLDDMLNKFSFDPKYLNQFERESIKNIFDKITDLDSSAAFEYNKVADKVDLAVNYGQANYDSVGFTNFVLQSANNGEVALADLVAKKQYTVFYFWFAGCGPCRRFNDLVSGELIDELDAEGIQLVHISTDFYRKNWEEATLQDSIFWTNLYGGAIQNNIEMAYKIQAYPTKVVVNNEQEVIDFTFKKPDDLLELARLEY